VKKGAVMDDKVKYWLDLAEEDLSVAKILINNNKFLHAAFNCHQAVEKSIKAVIARDLPEGKYHQKFITL
jgi:HEPN domain-containing protein